MNSFQQIYYRLGIPLLDEKTDGPTTFTLFLGLIQGKSNVTLKQLQSIIGSLGFVTRALPTGRTFTCRMYGLMSGVAKQYNFVHLTKEI